MKSLFNRACSATASAGRSGRRFVCRHARTVGATATIAVAGSAFGQGTGTAFPPVTFPYTPTSIVDEVMGAGLAILTAGFPVVIGIGFVMGLVYWIFGAFRR